MVLFELFRGFQDLISCRFLFFADLVRQCLDVRFRKGAWIGLVNFKLGELVGTRPSTIFLEEHMMAGWYLVSRVMTARFKCFSHWVESRST